MTSLLPPGEQKFFANDGTPLAFGTITFYIPGTTTPKNTWADPQSVTLNTNPIVLDTTGSAIIYGEGQYRIILKDSLGNQLYDQTTASSDWGISLTTLGVSTAMLPVVEASSLQVAANLLLNNPTHLNINPGDQSLTVAPTANPGPTLASLNVQGNTNSQNGREFIANLGLTSATGSGGTAGNDKVTLYSGLVANAGTSDVWTVNSCLTMSAGSGNYTAQGYELDFNNLNQDLGDGLLGNLGTHAAYGLSISGASTFASTAGILITGAANQWNRGILFANSAFKQDCIEDISTSPCTLRIAGSKQYGINMTNTVFSGAAMFLPNGSSSSITWQNALTTSVISDYVDSANNRGVGIGASAGVTNAIIMGASVVSQTPSTMNLGAAANRWNQIYSIGHSLPNQGQIQWAAQAGTVTIADYVDSANNRSIGANATGCFLGGVTTAPLNGSGQADLGTSTDLWRNIYATGTIIQTSDIRLKEDIAELPSVLDTVNAIMPISYKWKDTDSNGEKTHLGFSAQQIKYEFDKLGDDLAVHETANDIEETQMISKEELIPVLWKCCQELAAKIKKLEAKSCNC